MKKFKSNENWKVLTPEEIELLKENPFLVIKDGKRTIFNNTQEIMSNFEKEKDMKEV